MPKLVTFNVPAAEKKSKKIVTREKQGYVARLYVGERQRKFVLQLSDTDNEPAKLTDYASGQIVCDLRGDAIGFYVRTGGARPDYRKIAQRKLNELIAAKTADYILGVMNAAPVVNR